MLNGTKHDDFMSCSLYIFFIAGGRFLFFLQVLLQYMLVGRSGVWFGGLVAPNKWDETNMVSSLSLQTMFFLLYAPSGFA